ncbi:feline leukemia virus subgroup C receptor-related protein 2 [Nephila pilipes]|uniref:Feline leukemia virus subgroup C receptor-related protein 2 n=1 Tax=Nephila pilipes TaxID=299642 RepID=A0A8X6PRQ3_NEPPI|nr:feline leukemia virus subgroup C receptor-related protein 2 [Nephila pilipes]
MEPSVVVISNNNCLPVQDVTDDTPQKNVDIKVYKRRLWVLGLFSFSSMMSAMTFPQYVSMANINSCFYGVSSEAVDWTTLIILIVYLVFILPVSSLINYMDLRWTVICTGFWNAVGAATQFATLSPDSFPFVMVVSFFAALSNLFVLGVPPALAAKWFPSRELSRACSFGVFGNQLGVAIGFVFSPLIVPADCSRKDLISIGKRNVAYILTAVNLVVFILIVFTFQNAPKNPPSLAQAQKRKESSESHTQIIMNMLKNPNFILILIVYGLMVGSYYAIGTILNSLILYFFPHKEMQVGWMGLLFVVCGLVGSIIAGFTLDSTHKFKETSIAICCASLVTLIIFSGCLYVNHLWVQFITICLFGFCLTSFLPIGFEYGIEVTYPQSEAISACLLNASAMLFGIVLTEMLSHILENEGPLSSNAALTVTIFICCIITTFITRDYKRCKKNAEIKFISSQ